jgi:uncharacterized tellurite resistance protein B-like protein
MNAYIGYVFLYFYGLERRVFADARDSDQARAEIPAIVDEVRQLQRAYGSNRSFGRYSNQFLDAVTALAGGAGDITPPMDPTGNELPIAVRVGVGRIVAAGKPLPFDWALSWFLTHPESPITTAIRRCSDEFRELFRIRYSREFGAGLVLKPNRARLNARVEITPASASFGGHVEIPTDLPDVAVLTSPLSKLQRIGESCAIDLDAFSRWVGRNASSPKTIGAVALLPAELVTTHQSEEVQGLWDWAGGTIGSQSRTVCGTDELLQHCASFGVGKLARSEAVLLAQLLEKGGYGLEPDVRFGGAPLAPGGVCVLFKLPPGALAIASPQYAAATVLLHLAVTVSAADGSISTSEQEHLERHLQRSLAFGEAEQLRLSAHLEWLLKSAPSLTGMKKRLETLDQRQRSVIADFIVGVAGADGQITPDEIRTLGKLYPMLGLETDDVYSHVHAMTVGGAKITPSGDPVTVVQGRQAAGFAIPSRPVPPGAVQLDMAVVQAKLAESSRISAILADIFTEEETARMPGPATVELSPGKVPTSHRPLLAKLIERPEWSRVEFETVAAECRLMPDGAIDVLNEAAFEHAGGPLLEGDDPIFVDAETAKRLSV